MEVDLADLIAQARAGAVVSFPTDTVPALAVRPDRPQAIYQLKQREAHKPLILLGASAADLWPFAQGNTAEQGLWQAMADRYWPGALTLVLPASALVPAGLNQTATPTIGLRVPDHPVAQGILAQTGALATSSANVSGEPTLYTAAAIAAQFPPVAVLAGSACPAGQQPSTVIAWQQGGWQLLRSGALRVPELLA
jgi:L-threonylcarbamoyladenylate synthase